LIAKFNELKPQLFGALLDEVAAVLRRLPAVHLDRPPLMSEFARILAALDLIHAAPSAKGSARALPIEVRESKLEVASTAEKNPSLSNSPSLGPSISPSRDAVSPSLISPLDANARNLDANALNLDANEPKPDANTRELDAKSDGKISLSSENSDIHDDMDANGLQIYIKQLRRLAVDVIDGDPLAMAIADFVHYQKEWFGTAGELLAVVANRQLGPEAPRTPRSLSCRLRKMASALESVGIAVDYQRASDYIRSRRILLTAAPRDIASSTSCPS
jgi:hypothetical protein